MDITNSISNPNQMLYNSHIFLTYRNDVFEFIDRVYFMEERIFRSKNFSKLKKKIHDYKYHKNRQFDILIDFDVNFFQ